MTRVNLVAALILAFIAAVGGAFIIVSTRYSSGTIVVQSGKAMQFQVGLALLMVGLRAWLFWLGSML